MGRGGRERAIGNGAETSVADRSDDVRRMPGRPAPRLRLGASAMKGAETMYASRPERFLDPVETDRIEKLVRSRRREGIVATYAIGDVHGRADLLLDLLDRMGADAEDRGAAWTMVALGDYVDRGPDAAKAVAILRLLQETVPEDVVTCLRGNHEDMMCRAGSHPDDWNLHWGIPTLRSFGPDVRSAAGIPADVIGWARSLPTAHEDGLRIFVHAGLVPGAPLHRQSDLVRLHVREGFADADHRFEKFVVHGHTPTGGKPDVRRHRVNLDTGAGLGMTLTAGVFLDTGAAPVAFIECR